MANPTSIAPATGVGTVHLAVTDGDRAERFYRDILGLELLPSVGEQVRLGAAGRELVVLHPGADRPVEPHTAGLYHLAIVVPSRRELARVIGRLAGHKVPQSPTDHVMTKADYLWDPDGNGIEVYAETPEDGTFSMDGDSFSAVDKFGNVRSGRDPIDLDALFAELRPDDQFDVPMPPGTRMGHVHLHVSHLQDAVDFYHGLVGFDVMGLNKRFGAAFVSAGGYHHHLGLNTWAGEGVPPHSPDAAGLRQFTVELPTEGDREAVLNRLEHGGVAAAPGAAGYEVKDPSDNLVRLAVAAT